MFRKYSFIIGVFLFIHMIPRLHAMEGYSVVEQKEEANITQKCMDNCFELLPAELIEYVSLYLVTLKGPIMHQDFSNFAQVDRRTRAILMSEAFINVLGKLSGISPIIVARKLGINISDEVKEQWRQTILNKEIANQSMVNEDLLQWVKDKNLLLSNEKNSKFNTYIDKRRKLFFSCISKGYTRDVLAFLLDGIDPDSAGASNDIEDFIKNSKRTALMVAILAGHMNIVKLLLDLGANPNAISLLPKPDYDPYVRVYPNRVAFPLIEAIKQNKLMVELLLEAGANANRCDALGYVLEALSYNDNDQDNDIEIFKLLLKYSARVPNVIREPYRSYKYISLLNYSIRNLKNERTREIIINLLLEAGANPNWSKPLITAIVHKDVKTVESLLKYKADPNVQVIFCLQESSKEKRKATALIQAVKTGNVVIVRLLLEAGANPNVTDKMLIGTPLSFARNKEMIRLLESYGAKPSHCIIS